MSAPILPATPAAIVEAAPVRTRFAALLGSFAAGQGSSMRVMRLILMTEPPSLDKAEMTDKGSINQRAVLASRAALTAQLYAEPAPAAVIAISP